MVLRTETTLEESVQKLDLKNNKETFHLFQVLPGMFEITETKKNKHEP